MEYYVAIKGNRSLIYATAWINVVKWKKTDSKVCIFYGSIYMTSGKGGVTGMESRVMVVSVGESRSGWL